MLAARVVALGLRVQAPLLLEAQERQTLVAAVVAQARLVTQVAIERAVLADLALSSSDTQTRLPRLPQQQAPPQ